MPTLLLTVQYGGYISPIKLAVLILGFFLWIPMVNWIYKDTQEVRTKVRFWTSLITIAGAAGLLTWLLVPMFIIGMLIYIIGIGAISLAYVTHRNSRVADFEKVLTAEHFKSLFVNEEKRLEKATHGISFITANKNEVPLPAPKAPEAFGFKMACELFDDALWRRTSDIIFQPGATEYAVSYFIDGLGSKQKPRSREEMDSFIHFLKQLGDLDTAEKRKPQAGHFKVNKDDQSYEWEIFTAGSTAGEQLKISRRQEYGDVKVEMLGFNADQIKPVKELKELHKGLVLVSGPAKSGITTTLYALLRNHDPFMNNINTLERKPEAELQNITQHTFSLSDTGTKTFSKQLQTVLRMGPDIMGIADCNDKESAYLACAGVKQDVVIYPTIQAPSVMQALAKWIELVGDKELVADTLSGIINQRLVRLLCDECKQAYQPNQELFRKFNIPADKIKVLYRPGEIEYDKHGKPIVCEKCQGTGFYGRIGVFETIFITDQLREVIKKAKSPKEMAAYFRKAGMLYLQEQSIKKVAQGLTSINEVIRHFSPQKQQTKKSG